LLRDLKYIHEDDKKPWAAKMIGVLIKAKTLKEEGKLTEESIKNINDSYGRVLKKGFKAEPVIKPQKTKKRGRQKKSKSMRLLEVFRDAKDRVLRFVYDLLVPFDNNMAERDLRMIKLKQKISGTLRTKKGGQVFCRIRGYISTVRKHGYNIMDALKSAIIGKPMSFEII
jgi:transposase